MRPLDDLGCRKVAGLAGPACPYREAVRLGIRSVRSCFGGCGAPPRLWYNLVNTGKKNRERGGENQAVCHDELRQELLRQIERRLRERLRLQYASLEEVLILCLRQIEYGDLSCAALKEWLSKGSAKQNSREQAIQQWVEEICQRAANSGYVRDCERIARFLDPRTTATDREKIVWQFRAEYATWTYGSETQAEGDPPTGCLGARLIAYLGKREAGSRLSEGQAKVDAKVFSPEGFNQCACQYRPAAGRKFENFFKQWIGWRCGDVAKEMRKEVPAGGPPWVGSMIDLDAILVGLCSPEVAREEEDSPLCAFAMFHGALEAYRQEQADQGKATLAVAAFELRYRAYLDPENMTPATQRYVQQRLNSLRDEFFACQERLRVLEEKLREAEYDWDIAREQAEERRQAIENEGCSALEIDELQRIASGRNKTEMEKDLHSLGRGQRATKEGLRLQYMIAYKTLALAHGRLELRRKEWEQWAGCRKPWVRSQKEIEALLGIDQVTVSRYIAEVKGFVKPHMRRLLVSRE